MDFDAHFQAFLTSTVNLKPHKLTLLNQRVDAITSAFQSDAEIGNLYKEHLPQGSWAHQTIIDPVGDYDEFDADILLHLTPMSDWECEPKTYLREVRAAFKRSSTYKDKLQRKNRCVRIQYAHSCHVDIVPSITLEDGRQVIINYAENDFEETNPVGFADWMKERDELTNGNLRRVIRLLKWLRDYKNTFTCPSVILTVLFGGRAWYSGTDKYPDVPHTLVALLEDLDAYLSLHSSMPLLDDPSCPGTSFNHRWDEAQYQTFKKKVHDYATWAREALDLQDHDDQEAIVAWQKLFGDEFAADEVKAARASIVNAKSLHTSNNTDLEKAAPEEEFIHDKAKIERRYSARIDANIIGKYSRPLRKARTVRVGNGLRFHLWTDAPEPYEVWWKVRNRGIASERAGQLRGQIMRQGKVTRNLHEESASYPGRHYIEAYVIRNGVVVASDHHEVNILKA